MLFIFSSILMVQICISFWRIYPSKSALVYVVLFVLHFQDYLFRCISLPVSLKLQLFLLSVNACALVSFYIPTNHPEKRRILICLFQIIYFLHYTNYMTYCTDVGNMQTSRSSISKLSCIWLNIAASTFIYVVASES